ncbi:MAG: DUF885 family protein [Thermoanaerobaculia bacterium]
MRRLGLLSLGIVLLTLPAHAATASSGVAALDAAAAEYARFLEVTQIDARLLRGLPIDELPDPSPGRARDDARFGRRLQQRLAGVAERDLDLERVLSLKILRSEAAALVEAERFYWLGFPVTPYASPLRSVHRPFTEHAFAGSADLRHYLSLLGRYAAWIHALETKLRGQAERGIRLPRPEIPLVLAAFGALRQPVEKSLFGVTPERLERIEAREREKFHREVATAVSQRINPALESLTSYLSAQAAQAPAGVGLAQYPGGSAYYRWLVRQHTTLETAPEEIHRIGAAEIERIGAELDTVRREVAFEGSPADFRRRLRSDSRFFPKSADEIAARLLAAQEKLSPKVPLFFGRTPRAPYGVARLDPALEGGMTFGYYEPPTPSEPKGYYYYNGSKLESRSLLNAAALIYHELVPGHHFQIALQRENQSLPEFRRLVFQTAYVEGWGEYASMLAGEMGMYADPWDRAGRLMMDAFLSARLVVDTGMNALGWSRERATAYLREHTLESDAQIETETLRYSCDIPGQALAYKVGAKTIRDLREKARAALGPAFDVRRFHDAVLGSGSMPLSVLSWRIDRFIEEERKKR